MANRLNGSPYAFALELFLDDCGVSVLFGLVLHAFFESFHEEVHDHVPNAGVVVGRVHGLDRPPRTLHMRVDIARGGVFVFQDDLTHPDYIRLPFPGSLHAGCASTRLDLILLVAVKHDSQVQFDRHGILSKRVKEQSHFRKVFFRTLL